MKVTSKVLVVLIAIITVLARRGVSFKTLPRLNVIVGHHHPVSVSEVVSTYVGRHHKHFSSIKDVDNVQEQSKSKSGPIAYMKKYGPKYFAVWFSIYLPFLLTFFYVIDNDILNTVKYGIDPPDALNSVCNQFEKITHNYELLKNVRGSTHAGKFVTHTPPTYLTIYDSTSVFNH